MLFVILTFPHPASPHLSLFSPARCTTDGARAWRTSNGTQTGHDLLI
jgi:hypothetical protein